jgi:hypothetical protein
MRFEDDIFHFLLLIWMNLYLASAYHADTGLSSNRSMKWVGAEYDLVGAAPMPFGEQALMGNPLGLPVLGTSRRALLGN